MYSQDRDEECRITEEELDAIFGSKEELAEREIERERYFAELEAEKAAKEAERQARQERLHEEAKQYPNTIPF